MTMIERLWLTTRSISLFWRTLAVVFVLILPNASQALEVIADPKAMAERIVETIQTTDVEKIVGVYVEASLGKMDQEMVAGVIEPFRKILDRGKGPGTRDLLASKTYGNSIAIFWYLVIWEGQSDETYENVYVRLRFFKNPNSWLLYNFSMTDELDDAELP